MICSSGKAKGTCDDLDCEFHGVCHCGCGARPSVPARNHNRFQLTAGMPLMHVRGHHPNTRAVQISGADHPSRISGAVHRDDVPIERVRPLMLWLRDHYGSVELVAEALQLSRRCVWEVSSAPAKIGVAPSTARRIVEHVLTVRPAPPAYPWDRPEPRRVATGDFRRIDDSKADQKRRERRASRAFRQRQKEAASADVA